MPHLYDAICGSAARLLRCYRAQLANFQSTPRTGRTPGSNSRAAPAPTPSVVPGGSASETDWNSENVPAPAPPAGCSVARALTFDETTLSLQAVEPQAVPVPATKVFAPRVPAAEVCSLHLPCARTMSFSHACTQVACELSIISSSFFIILME